MAKNWMGDPEIGLLFWIIHTLSFSFSLRTAILSWNRH